MNFCPNCGDKLIAQTSFCSNCGHGFNSTKQGFNLNKLNPNIDISGLTSKPIDFLVILVGTALLIIMSLFTWARIPLSNLGGMAGIPLGDVNFNILSLPWQIGRMANMIDSFVPGAGEEFAVFVLATLVLKLLLLLSFALLVISLLKYTPNSRHKYVIPGFGLSALITVVFIITVLLINSVVRRETLGFISSLIDLTVFPYATVLLAAGAIVFLVKRPFASPTVAVSLSTVHTSAHIHTPSAPRMPLIFLLDTSVSTSSYTNKLNICLNRFRANTCLDVAVIQFGDSVNILQNFVPVEDLKPVRLTTSGRAFYSAPIREALGVLYAYGQKQTHHYKPWIIFIAGSEAADDITSVANEVKNMQSAGKLRFIALGVGAYNSNELKRLTDVVFRLDGTMDFSSFFSWISRSMEAIVRSQPSEKPKLPQLEGNVYRDM